MTKRRDIGSVSCTLLVCLGTPSWSLKNGFWWWMYFGRVDFLRNMILKDFTNMHRQRQDSLVGPILMIFSFYNFLIRWARVGWCVVLEPTWYWEQDLQSVRSCQGKPHFTGQLPGTIAINFVYLSLYRLLFLQIISYFKAVLSQLHEKSFAIVSKTWIWISSST